MRINIGSGIYPQKDFVNIDIDPSVKPDVVRDVRRGLPYSDRSIEEVRAYHFLEHLDPTDFLFVMSEVYRVLIPDGHYDIQVPLGITDDPTHRTFFAEGSFQVFTDPCSQAYYVADTHWKCGYHKVLQQKFPTLHTILLKGHAR